MFVSDFVTGGVTGPESLTFTAAPEPSQAAALGVGVLGLVGLAFKSRRRRSVA